MIVKNRKFTQDVENEIIRDYVYGKRSNELAKKYGCERSLISKIANRNGYKDIVSKKKGGISGTKTEHLEADIIRLHGDGLSQAKIGKEVGISQCVVGRVLRQKNLRPNNPHFSKKGTLSNFWKGGITARPDGYIYEMSDEFPTMKIKSGYILQHRLVMSRYLERPLHAWETVHHIDGNIENNEVSNLQLRIGKHGKSVAYACADCGSANIYPTKLK